MDMTDNMMLRSYRDGKGIFADRKKPKALAESLINKLGIVTPGVSTRLDDYPAVMSRRCLWDVKLP